MCVTVLLLLCVLPQPTEGAKDVSLLLSERHRLRQVPVSVANETVAKRIQKEQQAQITVQTVGKTNSSSVALASAQKDLKNSEQTNKVLIDTLRMFVKNMKEEIQAQDGDCDDNAWKPQDVSPYKNTPAATASAHVDAAIQASSTASPNPNAVKPDGKVTPPITREYMDNVLDKTSKEVKEFKHTPNPISTK
eukprot:GILJ01016443.1.p1 GENE.GILJ01016443.1~~GILJ01016443.1.p1  ORF type:complete len:211 (-),score=31.84 GILJ01016443.1:316-891(-)